MFSSSSEQECLSCMGQLSIRIKFNFANSIFSGSSTERGQVGIFGCLLTPCPGGSSRACSCCLPGGRHVYRRSSLAGGSHSSWGEFDVHGENVLSGLGRAVYLGWGRGFLRESSCWTAQRADAIQHEYFPPICAAWTALMGRGKLHGWPRYVVFYWAWQQVCGRAGDESAACIARLWQGGTSGPAASLKTTWSC